MCVVATVLLYPRVTVKSLVPTADTYSCSLSIVNTSPSEYQEILVGVMDVAEELIAADNVSQTRIDTVEGDAFSGTSSNRIVNGLDVGMVNCSSVIETKSLESVNGS